MILCKVVGKVVSTVKDERLVGTSLVMLRRVQPAAGGKTTLDKEILVAADNIGCGSGDLVLATSGSSARLVFNGSDAPVDLAVVGIADSAIEED